jgi:nicotinate-nucleotide pyrophosphorylase (carboxylating)
MKLSDEQKASIGPIVAKALAENSGSGNSTASSVSADKIIGATIVARGALVLYGELWVNEVFAQVDDTVIIDWYIGDNQTADTEDVICKLIGPADALLTGEQTALNFLRSLSSTESQNTDAVDFSMLYKIS